MKKSHIATLIVFLVLIPLTLILGSRLSGRAFYVTSTLVIVELLIPFFLAFEGRRPQARELVVPWSSATIYFFSVMFNCPVVILQRSFLF
jgi:hypothetical protein